MAPAFVDAAALDALVTGVTLLGSGGGGDARTYSKVLQRVLDHTRIRLHDPGDLPGARVIPVGVIGADSVLLEKLPGGEEFQDAVHAVTRWTGRPPDAVMSIEAGGVNGVAALTAAAQLHLPYLDADLMGRAMPRLDQFTWSVLGRPLGPCALAQPGGHIMVMDNIDAAGLERAARSFLSQSGGWGVLALPPAPVADVAASAVLGTARRALRLGAGHATLPESASPRQVRQALGGTVLGAGRVQAIDRHVAPAGRASLHVADTTAGTTIRVEAASEYLLALVNGRVAAATPDLVCLLDRRTLQPLATDRVRPGNEVMVITLPGPAWWHESDRRLQAVDPRGFGLDPAGPQERRA